ncbi:GtrA family protein [Candidatus Parcubacteria bacterium]|nr:MAG: GtrA family protein [Candidatus Parcubacteria bacterium]
MTDTEIVTSPETQKAPSMMTLGSPALHEFIRYFAASLIALVVDIVGLWLLTEFLDVPYLVSAAISFLLGLIIVYIASIYWVFEARSIRSPAAEFGIFLVIGLIGLGINELILGLLTEYAGLYYMISKIASVFVVFTWNFFARKYVLFAKAR